jgi:penicillin-binding protein 1A
MRWAAARSGPDRSGRSSQVLRPGDLILVRVKNRSGAGQVRELALEQEPKAESALICLEARSGHVKAMIGGRDFSTSQFNRAVQSRRQPGSAFKPIIYAAALDKGYTPATVLIDAPVVYRNPGQGGTWKPKNYGRKFYGPTSLRQALAHSRNVVTVKLLGDIGIDYAIDYARRLGIASPLAKDLSIALGSSGVSLLEIVKAYAVFANLGERIEPVFVTRVVDRDGRILEEARPERTRAIESSTAYLMTSLMQSVVQEGTGARVQALGRPVAGKTGTTDDLFDAWFVGYTPSYVTGVWVGFDDESSLGPGETGARAAIPVWLDFMQAMLADKPVEDFTAPETVVFAEIDADTGLLPIPQSRRIISECFKAGTVPTQTTQSPDLIVQPEDFYKSDI